MLFSIKKRNQWFWKVGLTREAILATLASGEITEDWLICPQGESGKAVPIRLFLENEKQSDREQSVARGSVSERHQAVDTPVGSHAGRLIGWLISSATVGGAIILGLLFPAFPFYVCFVLVPSWLLVPLVKLALNSALKRNSSKWTAIFLGIELDLFLFRFVLIPLGYFASFFAEQFPGIMLRDIEADPGLIGILGVIHGAFFMWLIPSLVPWIVSRFCRERPQPM